MTTKTFRATTFAAALILTCSATVLAQVKTEVPPVVAGAKPVTVEHIREWARARRLMPPKSTYFYPKPRTGMVYRSLDA